MRGVLLIKSEGLFAIYKKEKSILSTVYELKHKKRPVILDILLVLSLVIGLIVFTFLMYLIQELTGFGYMFYIEFILIIVFAIYFSKIKLIEFTYLLDGDILRIDRIYSKRPKLDLFIRMENVIFMGKVKDMPEKYKQYKKQRETFRKINNNALAIVHMIENKYFTAILTPSEAFETQLIKAWKQVKYQPKKKK